MTEKSRLAEAVFNLSVDCTYIIQAVFFCINALPGVPRSRCTVCSVRSLQTFLITVLIALIVTDRQVHGCPYL